MLWSDAAGAPRGGLSHGIGDRRTLHNSCDSPTRCATAREGCDANGGPLVPTVGGVPSAPLLRRRSVDLMRVHGFKHAPAVGEALAALATDRVPATAHG